MTIYKMKSYDEMSQKSAAILASVILQKPNCVLGLATGSSPVGLYKKLVEWYKNGILDFSQVSSVNLDEYKGLSAESDQSYRYFMNKNLFDHVNINKANTFVPNGMEADSKKACFEHENAIKKLGGIDIQLLGIGHNGHIGFNEPSNSFEKVTHCVDLAESTINANMRFFANKNDVPRQAYTMGIGTIMSAKKVLLVVSGKDKADIVAKAFFGEVTPSVPASILQFHQNFTLVGDEDALSKLPC